MSRFISIIVSLVILAIPVSAEKWRPNVLVIGIDTSSSTGVKVDIMLRRMFLVSFSEPRVSRLVELCFQTISFVPWSSNKAKETVRVDLHTGSMKEFIDTTRRNWPEGQVGGGGTTPHELLKATIETYPDAKPLVLIYLDDSGYSGVKQLEEYRLVLAKNKGRVFVATKKVDDLEDITTEEPITLESEELHVENIYSTLLKHCSFVFTM